jgi:hypothetical protein
VDWDANAGEKLMVKAVLKKGVVCPVEPLPEEWTEGQELWIEERLDDNAENLDRWYRDLEAMVSQNDPEDFARVQAALKEAHELAKAQVREEMRLP